MNHQPTGRLTGDGLPMEPVAIIGCRAADKSRVPIAGSSKFQCSRCSEQVMLSPATQRRMRLADLVICLDCAAAIAEQRGEKFIRAENSEAQKRERTEYVRDQFSIEINVQAGTQAVTVVRAKR